MVLKKKKTPKIKNISVLPDKSDFSDLDSAVSQLAKETEALLGKAGERMSKPILPKKKQSSSLKSNSKAKSFDIIHSPSANKKTEALLKAPHPGQKLLESEDENKTDKIPDSPKIPVDTKEKVDSVATLSTHSPGALKFVEAKTIEPTKVSDDLSDTKKDEDVKVDKIEEAQIDTLDNKSDVNDLSNDAKEDIKVFDDGVKPELESESEVQDSDKDDESDVDDSNSAKKVQLYSDNLTDSDKSTEEDSGLAIFDTEEYHPTLHDWSKLEHHSSWPKFVLLILLIVFAGVIYIVVSGMSLPFINL